MATIEEVISLFEGMNKEQEKFSSEAVIRDVVFEWMEHSPRRNKENTIRTSCMVKGIVFSGERKMEFELIRIVNFPPRIAKAKKEEKIRSFILSKERTLKEFWDEFSEREEIDYTDL